MSNYEDICWIVNRINYLEGRGKPSLWPTHKMIWQGSYDVWYSEQDRIDAVEIPGANMRYAEEAGFIRSEKRLYNGYEVLVWANTEKAKEIVR